MIKAHTSGELKGKLKKIERTYVRRKMDRLAKAEPQRHGPEL